MPAIKWSTLKMLGSTTNINLQSEFPGLQIVALSQAKGDFFIDITEADKAKIDSFIAGCPECGNPLPCQSLTENDNTEYKKILQNIDLAYRRFYLLKETPFRQSRNAFGFTSGLMGLANAALSLIELPVLLTSCLVFLPAILVGIYVYYRGKNEEYQINRDYEVKLFDEKLKVYTLFKEKINLQKTFSVELKPLPTERPNVSPSYSAPPYEKINSYNEKRWPLGNAISHYLVSMGATTGMILSLLKLGALAGWIAASEPLGFGIAIGAGILTGGFFAYRRYNHLNYKKTFETNLHRLEQDKKKLESQIHTLHKHQLSLSPAPNSQHNESKWEKTSDFSYALILTKQGLYQSPPKPSENTEPSPNKAPQVIQERSEIKRSKSFP